MKNELTKKFGLFTAIAMVVGIVIGSGVFFKAQNILIATGGNMPLGILAWALGGLVMLICIFAFANMATKYEKVNGVVDYAEVTCGKKYSYYVGWFLTTIYYPTLTSVLAWVSARYLCELIGWSIVGPECMAIAAGLLIASFTLNSLSPKLAGKFQVSTTIIKLIPLLLMAIVGTIYGLATGITIENFTHAATTAVGGEAGSLFKAVVATAFAYEGWIIATSINSEIKNSKRNLPLALMIGGIIIIAVYILYYIGVAGGATNESLINDGATIAFSNIFGRVGGTIVSVLVIISCLGTLNGLTTGCTRGLYSLACRNEGPNPNMFKQVDKETGMPLASCFVGLLLCAIWFVYFFGSQLVGSAWFGIFSFDSSELPIVTIYAMYIPIFVNYIIKDKDKNVFKRFILPILSICACLFMIFCAVMAHGVYPYQTAKADGNFSFPILFYLIVYALFMFVGFLFSLANKRKGIVAEAGVTVEEDEQNTLQNEEATTEEKEENLNENKEDEQKSNSKNKEKDKASKDKIIKNTKNDKEAKKVKTSKNKESKVSSQGDEYKEEVLKKLKNEKR